MWKIYIRNIFVIFFWTIFTSPWLGITHLQLTYADDQLSSSSRSTPEQPINSMKLGIILKNHQQHQLQSTVPDSEQQQQLAQPIPGSPQQPQQQQPCDRTRRILTDTHGEITDGPIGLNYTQDSHCEWLIKAKNDSQFITLTFRSMGTECSYDYIFVYDGDSFKSPLLGSFSGKTEPQQVVATSGSMLILLYSDTNYVLEGFKAEYYISNCRNNCTNRGKCVEHQCVCQGDWIAKDCSLHACPDECGSEMRRGYCYKEHCRCLNGYSGKACSLHKTHPAGNEWHWLATVQGGLSPRAAHTAVYVPKSDSLYVFGGYDLNKVLAALQIYRFAKSTWEDEWGLSLRSRHFPSEIDNKVLKAVLDDDDRTSLWGTSRQTLFRNILQFYSEQKHTPAERILSSMVPSTATTTIKRKRSDGGGGGGGGEPDDSSNRDPNVWIDEFSNATIGLHNNHKTTKKIQAEEISDLLEEISNTNNDHSKPTERYGHAAVDYHDGFVIFGGKLSNGTLTNELWFYNVSEEDGKQWSLRADHSKVKPPALTRHTLTKSTIDNYLYVFGGTLINGEFSSRLFRIRFRGNETVQKNTEDSDTDDVDDDEEWEEIQPRGGKSLDVRVVAHTTIFHKSTNSLIIYGGIIAGVARFSKLSDRIFAFHLAERYWTEIFYPRTPLRDAYIPRERAFHTATVIGNYMIIFGGYSHRHNKEEICYDNQMYLYHLECHTWINQDVLGVNRHSEYPKQQGVFAHAATKRNSNTILFVGGYHGNVNADLLAYTLPTMLNITDELTFDAELLCAKHVSVTECLSDPECGWCSADSLCYGRTIGANCTTNLQTTRCPGICQALGDCHSCLIHGGGNGNNNSMFTLTTPSSSSTSSSTISSIANKLGLNKCIWCVQNARCHHKDDNYGVCGEDTPSQVPGWWGPKGTEIFSANHCTEFDRRPGLTFLKYLSPYNWTMPDDVIIVNATMVDFINPLQTTHTEQNISGNIIARLLGFVRPPIKLWNESNENLYMCASYSQATLRLFNLQNGNNNELMKDIIMNENELTYFNDGGGDDGDGDVDNGNGNLFVKVKANSTKCVSAQWTSLLNDNRKIFLDYQALRNIDESDVYHRSQSNHTSSNQYPYHHHHQATHHHQPQHNNHNHNHHNHHHHHHYSSLMNLHSKMGLQHNGSIEPARAFTFEYLEPYSSSYVNVDNDLPTADQVNNQITDSIGVKIETSCHLYKNCHLCLSDSICGWCDLTNECISRLSNEQLTCRISQDWKYLILQPSQCPNCTNYISCEQCINTNMCEWWAEDARCSRIGRSETGIRTVNECPSPCYLRPNCSECIEERGRCVWCEATQQCFSFSVYTSEYQFGLCREWLDQKVQFLHYAGRSSSSSHLDGLETTGIKSNSKNNDTSSINVNLQLGHGMGKQQCKSCATHRNCTTCLRSLSCGWCFDRDNPIDGICMEGDFSHSLKNQCNGTVLKIQVPDNEIEWAYAQCPDVDECGLGLHDCHKEAKCTNTHGSYACHCRRGFIGDGRTSCVRTCYDVCAHGECSNSPDYQCKCHLGWTGADCSVNCGCNNHSTCREKLGKCDECQNWTEGEHCERCRIGSYGNATESSLVKFSDSAAAANNETINDDEQMVTRNGCMPCDCNQHGNVDLGVCDIQTGECYCQDNTEGLHCEVCNKNFYGDPRNGGQCYYQCESRGMLNDIGRRGIGSHQSKYLRRNNRYRYHHHHRHHITYEECLWIISPHTVNGSILQDSLIQFNIENINLNVSCQDNAIYVYDGLPDLIGNTQQSQLLGVFCNENIKQLQSIEARSGYLTIHFKQNHHQHYIQQYNNNNNDLQQTNGFKAIYNVQSCSYGTCLAPHQCNAKGQCLCPEELAGINCEIEKCPKNCSYDLKQGYCDKMYGRCLCASEYAGLDCSELIQSHNIVITELFNSITLNDHLEHLRKTLPRFGHSLVTDKRGSLWMFGGYSLSHGPLNDIRQYNTKNNTWMQVTIDSTPPDDRMPRGRYFHGCDIVHTKQIIYIYGGLTMVTVNGGAGSGGGVKGQEQNKNLHVLGDFWMFSIINQRWDEVIDQYNDNEDDPHHQHHHHDDHHHVIEDPVFNTENIDDVEFNTVKVLGQQQQQPDKEQTKYQRQRQQLNKPPPLAGHTLTYIKLHDYECLLLIGGFSLEYGFNEHIYEYNLIAKQWQRLTNISGARPIGIFGHTTVYHSVSNMLYVFGGYTYLPVDAVSTAKGRQIRMSNKLYGLNFNDRKWIELPKFYDINRPIDLLPRSYFMHSAITTDNYMLVFGGYTQPLNASDLLIAYIYKCNQWIRLTEDVDIVGELPKSINSHAMTYDQDINSIYIVGGWNGGTSQSHLIRIQMPIDLCELWNKRKYLCRHFMGCNFCAIKSKTLYSISHCYSTDSPSTICDGYNGTMIYNYGIACTGQWLSTRKCSGFSSCSECLTHWPNMDNTDSTTGLTIVQQQQQHHQQQQLQQPTCQWCNIYSKITADGQVDGKCVPFGIDCNNEFTIDNLLNTFINNNDGGGGVVGERINDDDDGYPPPLNVTELDSCPNIICNELNCEGCLHNKNSCLWANYQSMWQCVSHKIIKLLNLNYTNQCYFNVKMDSDDDDRDDDDHDPSNIIPKSKDATEQNNVKGGQERCETYQNCTECLSNTYWEGGFSDCRWSTQLYQCISPTYQSMLCIGGTCGLVLQSDSIDNCPEPCSAYKQCSTCLQHAHCGWCSLTGTNGDGVCTEGSLESPAEYPEASTCDIIYVNQNNLTEIDPKHEFTWNYINCPVENECENMHHTCNPRSEKCVDRVHGYDCECGEGYKFEDIKNLTILVPKKCIPICKQGCVRGQCIEPNQCRCDFGYVGSNCSIQCQCNGHSNCVGPDKLDECTSCQNNTIGLQCDKCKPLFVGNPRNNGECIPCEKYCNGHTDICLARDYVLVTEQYLKIENMSRDELNEFLPEGPPIDDAICLHCSNQTSDDQCNSCLLGYFRGTDDLRAPCRKCECHGHGDLCDSITGEKCNCGNNTESDSACYSIMLQSSLAGSATHSSSSSKSTSSSLSTGPSGPSGSSSALLGNSKSLTTPQCWMVQCSKCRDSYVGNPIDGHQCYKHIAVESKMCFDAKTIDECKKPTPLKPGQTVFFALQPRFMNVDIRIIIDVTQGELDLYMSPQDDSFVVHTNLTNGYQDIYLDNRYEWFPDRETDLIEMIEVNPSLEKYFIYDNLTSTVSTPANTPYGSSIFSNNNIHGGHSQNSIINKDKDELKLSLNHHHHHQQQQQSASQSQQSSPSPSRYWSPHVIDCQSWNNRGFSVKDVQAMDLSTYITLHKCNTILRVYKLKNRLVLTLPQSSHNLTATKFFIALRSSSEGPASYGLIFFRQDQLHIDLFVFFSVFFSCFFLFLAACVVAWKAKQAADLRRAHRRHVVEMLHMAKRPFASVTLLIHSTASSSSSSPYSNVATITTPQHGRRQHRRHNNNHPHHHQYQSQNYYQQQQQTVRIPSTSGGGTATTSSSKHNQLTMNSNLTNNIGIKPISYEPTADGYAAVTTVFVSLPGKSKAPVSLAMASSLIIMSKQLPLLNTKQQQQQQQQQQLQRRRISNNVVQPSGPLLQQHQHHQQQQQQQHNQQPAIPLIQMPIPAQNQQPSSHQSHQHHQPPPHLPPSI